MPGFDFSDPKNSGNDFPVLFDPSLPSAFRQIGHKIFKNFFLPEILSRNWIYETSLYRAESQNLFCLKTTH